LDFNIEEIKVFIEHVKEFNFIYDSNEFYRVFANLKFLVKNDKIVHPTGLGILLFGKNPQVFYPQAVIRATYRTAEKMEDIITFTVSLPRQVKDCFDWFKRMIGKQISRSSTERGKFITIL